LHTSLITLFYDLLNPLIYIFSSSFINQHNFFTGIKKDPNLSLLYQFA
jgi:hypothetical protein